MAANGEAGVGGAGDLGPAGLVELLSGLIDYAGLFPPAKLAMPKACELYANYGRGMHSRFLGRFICPCSRLEELSSAASALMPGTAGTSGYREHAPGPGRDLAPWRVSALADGALESCLAQIERFNERHASEDHGLAIVDAIELKPASSEEVDESAERIPDELYPFFEVPGEMVMKADGDCRGFVASLAGHMAGAKIRTGGVVPEAFPPSEGVAKFILACVGAEVPFKATAGLHHPVRAEHPLTYEPGCPRGTMHGFLNVFLAAALAYVHRSGERAMASMVALLSERDGGQFHFTEEGVRWRDALLTTAQIAKARESFALSYGSCSFEEPIADLRAIRLLC